MPLRLFDSSLVRRLLLFMCNTNSQLTCAVHEIQVRQAISVKPGQARECPPSSATGKGRWEHDAGDTAAARQSVNDVRFGGHPRHLYAVLLRRLRSCPAIGLSALHLSCQLIVLFNIGSFPGVADPLVADCAGGHIAALIYHVLGESSLLWLVLVLFCLFQRQSASVQRAHPSTPVWLGCRLYSRAAQRC